MNLIQSTFGSLQHGNFELVALEGRNLVHFFRDNRTPTGSWQRGRVISEASTGSGWLVQSKFGSPPITNFEVVALEGRNLVHYFRDNRTPTGPWQRGRVISQAATGYGSLIQSNFGGPIGNFEVIVPEGSNLVHYFRDNRDPQSAWQRGRVVTDKATGSASLIQSDFGGVPGNFELLALEGNSLVHYFRDNRFPESAWQRGAVITTAATGPGTLIQSRFGNRPGGNFEVVVLEGRNLVHYFRDNTQPSTPWRKGLTITAAATGPAAFIQSSFGGPIGNFEVIVPEGAALAHYFRDNRNPQGAWQRGRVVVERAV